MSGPLSILDGATRALAQVSTAGEAWQLARDAEAARTYAKMRNLGAEATNYATGIKAKAMMLLAEFVDRGQADGTIRRQGQTWVAPTSATLAEVLDLGEDDGQRARDVVREARALRDALDGADIDGLILQANTDGTDFGLAGLRMAAAADITPPPVVDPPPLPEGRYRTIVIDPPWPMRKITRQQRPNQGDTLDYATMTVEQIGDLDVSALAADGCHLYLWVTHRFLPDGLDLFTRWGAAYECLLTWRKNVGITPFSWMYDTEHVLFGRIGALPLEQLGLRLSFDAPVTVHSAKPEVFYERAAAASPEPRLEMFARQPHDGFTPWGAEVPA